MSLQNEIATLEKRIINRLDRMRADAQAAIGITDAEREKASRRWSNACEENDQDRERLQDLKFQATQEITCHICNEPAPDGLEACSKCYGRHYVSTCKIDDIKTLLQKFSTSDLTEAEALIQIDTITTRGDDRK